MSKISWTGQTWNAIVGCSKKSAGCKSCYAMGDSPHRFASKYERDGVIVIGSNPKHPGLTYLPTIDGKSLGKGAQWTGEIRCLPWALDKPLRRKKPTTYFVNSLSDLFHETLVGCEEGRRFIAAMFGVMAACPQHTFQILTKRPERAREWFAWLDKPAPDSNGHERSWYPFGVECARYGIGTNETMRRAVASHPRHSNRAQDLYWPLPNVWMLTSISTQADADQRIPELLAIPAALHGVSAEPLLGPIDLSRWIRVSNHCSSCGESDVDVTMGDNGSDKCMACYATNCTISTWGDDQALRWRYGDRSEDDGPPLSWVIVGGESGPKARECEVAWIRSIVDQCQAAHVPAFCKQLGSYPMVTLSGSDEWPEGTMLGQGRAFLNSRNGSDPWEWPEDLRVREMPDV